MSKCVSITTDGNMLRWTSELRYLGVFIVSSKEFKCSMESAKKKFYKAANGIFSKIGNLQPDVILCLIKSYCLPVLLYGVESIVLNRTELTRLTHPTQIAFIKIFKTYNKDILNKYHYFMGGFPVNYRI